MRTRFDEQLNMLHTELIAMGALCEDAICAAMAALLDEKTELRQKALETDGRIDQKERDIEAMCMKLLLQQQPVARDLRTVSAALRMISNMERIGDQAADIAEIVQYIAYEEVQGRVHLRDMADAAIRMVTSSVDAFVHSDVALAAQVVESDDVVDDLFIKIRAELIALIGEDSRRGALCIDLLMVAKYLERIGDHAVNIAEAVEYCVTGKSPAPERSEA